MEGTIVFGSGPSRIRWGEASWAPDSGLVFDGVKDLINRYPEWNEVGLCLTSLAGFGSSPGLACEHRRDCGWDSSSGELCRLLDLGVLFRGATGGSSSPLFNLYILIFPDKDIPHLGDIVLHQMFVEGVNDLQPTDKSDSGYFFVTVGIPGLSGSGSS